MDNKAQDFARQIVALLGEIKRLIGDSLARPNKERSGTEHHEDTPQHNKPPTPARFNFPQPKYSQGLRP